jgi:hypothetical protein
LALASRSSEFLRAVWSAAVASRDRALSAAVADASSERCRDEDCCCAVEAGRSLLASAGVLLSTSAPKLSLPDDWSARAGFGGAVGKDTLATASDVTLCTGCLSGMNWN